MSDEIYDAILYDDARFEPLAPLAGDLPCLSLRRPVEGASRLRLARGLGRAQRRSAAPAATSTTRWTCSARCACAPTCRASSRSSRAARRRHDHAAVRAGRSPVRDAPRGDRSLRGERAPVAGRCRRARCTRFPAVIGDAARGLRRSPFALELLENRGRAGRAGLELQRALPQPFPRDAAAGSAGAARGVRAHRARAGAPRRAAAPRSDRGR